MKVIQFTGYGGLDRLVAAEREIPQIGAEEILVRVIALSVNPIDWKLHEGRFRWVWPVRFPSIPCFDLAGIVDRCGVSVTDFQPGDHVFGMLSTKSPGTAAEYIAVKPTAIARMPESLSFEAAAAIPLAGMTALQALTDQGRLQPGQSVLVVGAAGGVGHLAVQLAKVMGAKVTGVCSQRNEEFVRSLGADEVLDYSASDFTARLGDYSLILDCAMTRPFAAWRSALAANGVYVNLLPVLMSALWAAVLPFFSKQRIRFTGLKPSRHSLEKLAELVAQGRLRAEVESVYPFSSLADALAHNHAGHTRGKVVVRVADSA